MWLLLKDKFFETIKTIAPLILVVCLLQAALVKAPVALFLQFLAGSLLSLSGLVLFFVGIDMGILPMGRFIGAKLPQKGSLPLIMGVAFLFGFATTVAEPDVLVLSHQIQGITQGAIPGNNVLLVISVGVGFAVAMAMARIVFGFPMTHLLTAALAIVILLSFLTPPGFVSLAYDSGSVTTGALSAPVIISLSLGLSSVLSGRSNLSDGFGLLGLASIGPIIAVMILGILMH